MPDKRSASQQRKTNQNRAARQSLASRRAAAAEQAEAANTAAGPDDDASADDVIVDDGDVVAPDEVVAPPGRGLRGRLGGVTRPPSTPRPTRSGRPPRAPSPVPETGPGIRGWFQAVRLTSGGRWAAASFLLSILVAVLFSVFAKFTVVDHLTAYLGATAQGQKPSTHQTSRSLIDLLGPSSVLILGSPILILAAALAALRRPERRRAWLYCAVALGLWLVLLGGLALIPASLVVCATFWFAAYQNAKAERAAA